MPDWVPSVQILTLCMNLNDILKKSSCHLCKACDYTAIYKTSKPQNQQTVKTSVIPKKNVWPSLYLQFFMLKKAFHSHRCTTEYVNVLVS